MSKDKSGNWFSRHKILSVIGVVAVLGVIASATSGGKSNTDTVKNSNSNSSQTEKSAETKQEALTIKNSVAIDKGYGMTQVDGEVTNNDTAKHSATLKVTFYDANGKILGTASGAVNDLAQVKLRRLA